MSTLNKVLAVLNVLAAIGFLCVAGLDYGKRQAWMYAARQQDFIIKGLPVDENEKDVEGRPLVDAMGKSMQQQLFAGVSDPVTTQKAEVKKRYDALRTEINEAPDPDTKKKILEAVLVPLTRTWGQRYELQRKIRDPQAGVDTLLAPDGPFDAAFAEALEGKTVAGQDLGLEERREAIAHLLFNLSDKPDLHSRTVRVVGLAAYTREADSQATALQNMVPELEHAREKELTAFEVEHKELVRQIVAMAERVREVSETLKKQQLLAQHHTTLVAARQGDVQKITAEIKDAKKAAELALAGQSRLENALFRADQAITAAAEKNQQLLQQINNLEIGR
jgi:hypothetical protein